MAEFPQSTTCLLFGTSRWSTHRSGVTFEFVDTRNNVTWIDSNTVLVVRGPAKTNV